MSTPSQAQCQPMARAKHAPEKKHTKPRGLLGMKFGMPMKKGMPEKMLPKRKSLRLRLKRRGGH